MNEHGKSDRLIVPAKSLNNAKVAAAEVTEESSLAKGNTDRPTRSGHSAGPDVTNGLDRVRRAAMRDKEAKFTALMHHVDIDRLRVAYRAINPKAATGVDRVTWSAYGQDLEVNLLDLHARVRRVSSFLRQFFQLFSESVISFSGWLIHATVGSAGGVGTL